MSASLLWDSYLQICKPKYVIYLLVTLSPTHSQTNWQCFNSCTWQLRKKPTKLPGTVASCSPHWQTVTNHFLLLFEFNHVTDTAWKPHPSVAAWLVPLLTTHFLIKCVNAMFHRREKSLWMFRGSPLCTEDALPTSCRNSLQAPGPPLPLAKCYPHPIVDFFALFLQCFWLTHYLLDSTSLLLYSKEI